MNLWRCGWPILAAVALLWAASAQSAPLAFSVQLSEAVVVDTGGGVPRIALDVGGVTRQADYTGGAGSDTLSFSYAIQAGDFDANGIAALSPIDLNGATITDAAGNAADLGFVPPDMSGVRIQTYTAAWTTDPITAANASSAGFSIAKAPIGATFDYSITSDGGAGSVTGSGTIAAAPHTVTGVDLSSLPGGTLTLSVTVTTAAGGTGASRTAEVTKTPWTPADLGASLALWLDAADASTIMLNGANVAQWRDKSGNGHHIGQATAAAQPALAANLLNGKPGVRADGVDDELIAATGFAASSISVFAVERLMAWASDTTKAANLFHTDLPSSGTSNLGLRKENYNNAYLYRIAPGLVAGPTFASGQTLSNALNIAHLTGVQFNRGTAVANGFLNGTALAGVTIATPPTAFGSRVALFVGFAEVAASPPRNIHADVFEFVIVASVLSAADRQRLEGYLAHKWGLAANLPAGHPYKAVAP